MSKRHTLKCWPENFQATWDGVQTYSIRNNDRGFKVGDSIQIEEYTAPVWKVVHHPEYGLQNVKTDGYYTGRVMGATINHITNGGDLGLPSHVCVLGLHIWKRDLFNDHKA